MQLNVGQRIASMFVDHLAMTLIVMVFAAPGLVYNLIQSINSHTHILPSIAPSFITILGFALYFCKDCVSGRSIAKRLFSLKVVNNNTGEIASPLRCLIRNIFCIIWPVEILITFFNPTRRLGDLIAGTRVAKAEPSETFAPLNYAQIIFSLILPVTILYVAVSPLRTLQAKIEQSNPQKQKSGGGVRRRRGCGCL
ncbi:MAG: RDD family protein [Janthinobacterium lividum]